MATLISETSILNNFVEEKLKFSVYERNLLEGKRIENKSYYSHCQSGLKESRGNSNPQEN